MKPRAVAGLLAITALVVTALAAFDPISLFLAVSYGLVGALLVLRQPGNVVGWLLLLIAFGFSATTTPAGIDLAALTAGTADLDDFLPVWLSSWGGGLSFIAYTTLTLIFPSGRLPRGRWRRLAIALLAFQIGLVALSAVAPTLNFNVDGSTTVAIPNQLALLPDLPLWAFWSNDAAILVVIVALVLGAGSLVVRYRRSRGVERLQIRWLVAAIAGVVAALAFGLASLAVLGEDAWFAWIPAILAYPLVPVAIGIAVLRYRLYEIDRIVSRTIGYGIVTAVLGALFAGLVVGLSTLLQPITGRDAIPVAASTLGVAALFQPLRRRVQAIVDRRFYRAPADAARTVASFADRLRDEIDLASLTAELDATVRQTLAPSDVRVWLRAAPARAMPSGPP